MMNSEQVQGTNDSSIVSKLSMVERGYFEDDFIKYFVEKPSRRSPLINRCYHARAASIFHCVEQFVRSKSDITDAKQIVSLGAGFDTTYLRLKKKGLTKNLCFFEIDYPEVMMRKIALAKRAHLLQEDDFSGHRTERELGVLIFKSNDYITLGYDLQLVGKQFYGILQSVGVDFEKPTLFLSEVVLTYLPSKKSSSVLQWISENFSHAVTVVFEQVTPNDSFGKVMCKHFKQIGSPLLTIDEYPTIADHVERHHSFGFIHCNATSLDRFYYRCLPEGSRKFVEKLEVFDEFEAWHRACQHYFVLCSTNSNSENLQLFCKSLFRDANAVDKELYQPIIPIKPIMDDRFSHIKRFGHCSSSFRYEEKVSGKEREFIAVIGGFGISDENSVHQRLHNDITVYDICARKSYRSRRYDTSISNNNAIPFPMFASCVACKTNKPKILIFGGRSSPIKCTNSLFELEIFQDQLHHKDFLWRYKIVEFRAKDHEDWPASRWRQDATIITNNKGQEFMVIYGGRDADTIFDDLWVFNIESRKWNKMLLKGNEITPRHSHSLCTMEDGDILLSGGIGQSDHIFTDIFKIVLNMDVFEANVERVVLQVPMSPVYSHTSHCKGDFLVLVGGVTSHVHSKFGDEKNTDVISILNLKTGKLKTCSVVDGSNSIIMLHNHTSELLCSGQELVIIGGGDNCFSFGTWFNLSPISLSSNSLLPIK